MTTRFSSTLLLGLVVGGLFACSKGTDQTANRAAASASASAAPLAPSAPRPTASASAAPSSAGASWVGSYEASEGTLYVPDGGEWANVKFRGEKSDVGLGKGDIKLEIDPKGVAIGTIEGPLGPAVVTGSVHERVLTAHVYRKDPSDKGFSGTLSGKVGADSIDGTMNLSQGEARIIRAAKFSVKRK